MNFYYAFEDDAIQGPVSREVLAEMHKSGRVKADTRVIAQGQSEWSVYGDLPGVHPAPPAAPVASMAPAPSGKTLISGAAARFASAATLDKGEFDANGTLTFPTLKASQGLLALDPSKPSSWQFHIRVFLSENLRLPQLYIVVSNQAAAGLVLYDRARLPGGDVLEMKHINHKREGSGDVSWVEEHLGIVLTPAHLRAYLQAPLRIQISRRDEGIEFVVEVPPDYVAGVLSRLDPQDYELDPAAPVAVDASPGMSLGASAAVAGLLFGAFVAYNGGFVMGLIGGVLFGAGVYLFRKLVPKAAAGT